MAKKTKHKMYGTVEGSKRVRHSAEKRCSERYREDDDQATCKIGALNAGLEKIFGRNISNRHYCSFYRGSREQKICHVGFQFYEEEYKKLPKSLASKKRRR